MNDSATVETLHSVGSGDRTRSRNRSCARTFQVLKLLLLVPLVFLIAGTALSRPLHDFLEYWTMGHLFIEGHNPYSLIEVFRREVALGWNEPAPLIALNPPWILPLLAPLGLFHSYSVAWLTWNAMLAAFLLLSSFLLFELYAPDVHLPQISDTKLVRCLFVFTFYPAMLIFRYAQITPLVLLGITGFLWLEKRDHPILAGSALALVAVKPHLVYLVLLAILAQAVRTRSARILVGMVCSLVLLTCIALLRNPQALRQYLELSSGPYSQLYPSAVGRILRFPFGSANTFFLQFVPSIAGILWFGFYSAEHRYEEWNWLERMPMLIAISVLTTSHGWLFDQLLLVVPVVHLFAHFARSFGKIPLGLVLIYTALNIVVILGGIFQDVDAFSFSYLVAPLVMYGALIYAHQYQVTARSRAATWGESK